MDEQFFNNMLGMLENTSQIPVSQEQAPVEQEDEFITNLRQYDSEQEATQPALDLQTKYDEVDSYFNERLQELDDKIALFSFLDSGDGDDFLAKFFDPKDSDGEVDTYSGYSGEVTEGVESGRFAGIFHAEGAKLGQPTNLNSSAIGRGQMIKGTRELMYKKLGIPKSDYSKAEQEFKTNADFEMQVLNAYRDDLDKKIPSNIQGQQRDYMIAKGWYTGDVNYPDDKVPGREAGNKLTARQYALKTLGIK